MSQPSSLRQKWTDLGFVFLLNSDGDLKIQFPKGVMTSDLAEEIRNCKSKIIDWLRETNRIDGSQQLSESARLSYQDLSIIQSYPSHLHDLLKTLVDVRDGKYAEFSLMQQDLENFRHNMRWCFVSIEYYIKGWHPADVRTLWSDGWREHDIIYFMASHKVKYIMCHNAKIIQCLDLQNNVYVFEKNKSNSSEPKPVEEGV